MFQVGSLYVKGHLSYSPEKKLKEEKEEEETEREEENRLKQNVFPFQWETYFVDKAISPKVEGVYQ